MKDKRVFKASIKVGEKDGNPIYEEKEFAVIRPNLKLISEANRLSEQVWNQAFSEGAIVRKQLDDELKRRKLWNDQLQAEYDQLQYEVIQKSLKLEKGGIKLSEARTLAIEISKLRQKMVDMLLDRSELDNHTCEGRADNQRFNFLFANCLVYNDTGEKVYPNGLDDYEKDIEQDYAIKGATEFYYLMSGSESLDDQLPENKFLKKYKFVDDKSRFVERETGRLIDESGRYINEDGYYIEYNEDGTTYRVDVYGNKLEESEIEEYDTLPFLDDDGNPIIEEEKPRRKRRTKKTVEVDNTDA